MDRTGKIKGKPPEELLCTLAASAAVTYLDISKCYVLLLDSFPTPKASMKVGGVTLPGPPDVALARVFVLSHRWE